MKRALRVKSVGTKVSAAELRVLESRAAAAGLTLSEWVRDVLLGSSVEMGAMAAERTILAEVLAMRTILLNFMAGGPINRDHEQQRARRSCALFIAFAAAEAMSGRVC